MHWYWMVALATFAVGIVGIGFSVGRGYLIKGEFGEPADTGDTVFWMLVLAAFASAVWPASVLFGFGYWFSAITPAEKRTT